MTSALGNELPVEEELLVVVLDELELLVMSVVELLAVDELSVVELLAVVELSVVVFVPEEKLAWHDWSIFAETFFGGVEFCSSVNKFLFCKLFGKISAALLFGVFGKFSVDNFVGLFAKYLVTWILFDKFDSSAPIFGTFSFVCFGGVVGKLFLAELFVDEDVSVVVA